MKVQNIVNHSYNELRDIYAPILNNLAKTKPDIRLENDLVSYQLTPPVLADLVPKLPL